MYAPNTVLELKEPKSMDGKPFPYDEVRVVGPSPIQHPVIAGAQWSGGDAQGVIITPLTDFAGNLDEPFGKLQALYNVKSVPERNATPQKVVVIDATSAEAGDTPEQVFAREAPGDEASVDGKRVRSPGITGANSPLEDPRARAADGPLGAAPKPSQAELERAAAEQRPASVLDTQVVGDDAA